MLSKDYENLALKGNSVTISGWLSCMATDQERSVDTLEGFKAEAEPEGKVFRRHCGGTHSVRGSFG